nr:alanyl-tRNA editing protein [Woeseiaceae bacterium]
MTDELFREDSYLKHCDATVTDVRGNGVVLDRTVFYPLGGGQPGDTGALSWDGKQVAVIDTRYGEDGAILHVLDENGPIPDAGTAVRGALDWERRYRHMRMHTAMHLLGSVLQYGVTGGNISAAKSRLDFDMEDTVDKEAVGAALAKLVADDHPVSCRWITEAELDAQPELVRT